MGPHVGPQGRTLGRHGVTSGCGWGHACKLDGHGRHHIGSQAGPRGAACGTTWKPKWCFLRRGKNLAPGPFHFRPRVEVGRQREALSLGVLLALVQSLLMVGLHRPAAVLDEQAPAVAALLVVAVLHDDVVDISSLRRGRPTANAEFGNAPSVLVGDFIYSRAFQMLVGIGNMNIMALMSDTTNQIAEGEVLQLTKAGDATTSESEYLRVITDKTAILFAAALEGTAILQKADTQTQQSLKEYGLALGIAFQVADDILDYQGDAEVMGKNVGDDLSEGKPTLPLIYAMEQATADDTQIIKDAITNKSAEQMSEIFRIIQDTKALDYCKSFAAQYVNQAKTALSPLKDSEYKKCLDSLCDFAVERVQ